MNLILHLLCAVCVGCWARGPIYVRFVCQLWMRSAEWKICMVVWFVFGVHNVEVYWRICVCRMRRYTVDSSVVDGRKHTIITKIIIINACGGHSTQIYIYIYFTLTYVVYQLHYIHEFAFKFYEHFGFFFVFFCILIGNHENWSGALRLSACIFREDFHE